MKSVWMPMLAMAVGLLVLAVDGLAKSDYEAAYEQTQAEFQAVVDTASQTSEKIGEIKEKLEQAEAFLKANPGVADSKKILKKIGEAKTSLAAHAENLDKFTGYAGKVTDAFATANELMSVRNDAKAHSGGKLAENLHYIGTAMDKFGEKVPLIGPAVQAYGQMTVGLLGATDQVAEKIKETRNQGLIGAGTYGGTDNEKYQKLREQFGRDYADHETFEPSQSNFIYRPVGDRRGDALIWDGESKEWHRVPGNIPVEQIYRDNLLAGERRTPWQIKVYAENYDKAQARRNEAEQAYDYLKREWSLPYGLMNKDEFIAGYTYSKDDNQKIRDRLTQLRDQFEAEGDKRGIKGLDKFLEKSGIKLPERKEPEKEPGTTEDAADAGSGEGDPDGEAGAFDRFDHLNNPGTGGAGPDVRSMMRPSGSTGPSGGRRCVCGGSS